MRLAAGGRVHFSHSLDGTPIPSPRYPHAIARPCGRVSVCGPAVPLVTQWGSHKDALGET